MGRTTRETPSIATTSTVVPPVTAFSASPRALHSSVPTRTCPRCPGPSRIARVTTTRLPITVGAFETTVGVRASARRRGRLVSTSEARETMPKTASWTPTFAPSPPAIAAPTVPTAFGGLGQNRAPMSTAREALAWADAQVAAARDDPAARLALLAWTYHGPTGRAPRHLPFRRAALSFMRWQVQRGLLNPSTASSPGSVWWRAVNERLLRDGCEVIALVGGLHGGPSSRAVELWLQFVAAPTPSCWYRAHNASIVAGYLEHEPLADSEAEAERFFMNVALARVLYAHALVAAPRLALGRLAPLSRVLGDPRLGFAGVCFSRSAV